VRSQEVVVRLIGMRAIAALTLAIVIGGCEG